MSLSCVPLELLVDILAYALDDTRSPSNILCVNSTFHAVSAPLVHSHLRFTSLHQLVLFSEFVFRRCLKLKSPPSPGHPPTSDSHAQVPLDLLSLSLHSHSSNPHLDHIYKALSLANPRTFIWKGPDPEHHFSIAIVPWATHHLIRAIGTWAAVEHITLTNLTFPSDELGLHTPWTPSAPLLPVRALPRLRTVLLGKATLLPPPPSPRCSSAPRRRRGGGTALERIRLVDTYRHSIWGPRIRLRDVVDALDAVGGLTDAQRDAARARVQRVVVCEKRTERIEGGDNGDDVGVLG
ncbi:uncharacterized protein BXZ73DRAFT_89260 [Epithele typhae]|uniref:uncharacterized protein n=1 Tax=Epithele typhae TaxID=378194 RepID=UPI0020083E5D|nr:uncharacterized protein BXZ73DRAFT_89260 [Epithele typhae]KAH9937844.1 hypothetical protein BXZ73DRAFT_89260 [Epithele typhae]